MLVNKNILSYKWIAALLLIMCAIACVEEFSPELNESASLLVVDARIVKGDSVQTVYLSRSTSIYDVEFIPVTNYDVWVLNSNDVEYHFVETSDGTYTCVIPDSELAYNTAYKLYLTSTTGERYESAMESISESSPIDSIYYEITSYTSSTESYSDGAQFYVDLKAPEASSKNYRWIVEETYEYHAGYPISGYWDGSYDDWLEIDEASTVVSWDTVYYGGDTTEVDGVITVENMEMKIIEGQVIYVDWVASLDMNQLDIFRCCYQTIDVSELYTSTTNNLTANEKKKIPINYVPTETRKLNYNYSVLVRQYALSDDAYIYWNQNQIQSSSSGGLYQTQPSQSQSNIVNIDNPDEKVLGFFWATSFSEQRVVLTETHGDDYSPSCAADTIETYNVLYGFEEEVSDRYIAFLGTIDLVLSSGNIATKAILGLTPASCTDCREAGGTLEKPAFFD